MDGGSAAPYGRAVQRNIVLKIRVEIVEHREEDGGTLVKGAAPLGKIRKWPISPE